MKEDIADNADDGTTDFGFTRVNREAKAHLVRDVFDSVASRYDLMNDLMSGGVHRFWKRFTIELSGVRPGQTVLDIAGGTGDLAAKFSRLVGSEGRVILADINAAMLEVGRDRLIDTGAAGNVDVVQADAQALPFEDNSIDCITIAFGLRNVTDKDMALRSMLRVLRPGGRLLVLEFSKPVSPLLGKIYDQYSFQILPAMGRWIAQDADSYRYLAESIRQHPDQETLLGMMANAGFVDSQYHNMTGGIVAVHQGFKA
ncbi:MAG: bifunctional demethylmenaquinone methyltransferase/2-methoxy-6-polyprenyl-1,4-benzoquinol methylase UbiE [Luminiphilus sp.]|jgi:demethylmenaquinone methyltransferase / 2-methoxy-6-polyprenyl-1,4-benzoquinol methylase|nr:bifunctional demethylmenaquinone methyltransferase/2-methoxy-6-polyprenyl-1,4-benzoquinol methylase UbiE [Luminiphilus sp.]